MRAILFKIIFLLPIVVANTAASADDATYHLGFDFAQKIQAKILQQSNDTANAYRQTHNDLPAQGYNEFFQCKLVNSQPINYVDSNNVIYLVQYDLNCWVEFDRREADANGKMTRDHLIEFELNGAFISNFETFEPIPQEWKQTKDTFPSPGGGNSSSVGG